jgi:NADPH:quinone reductase-like Zn-dependent oxidoreductase
VPSAIVLNAFGLGNLRQETRPLEPLADGLARVEIRAVSLNYRDLLVTRGVYDPGLKLPLIPLSDAAGVILECGSQVDGLRPGDRVVTHAIPDWQEGPFSSRLTRSLLGGPAQGVLSEQRVLPARALLRIPEGIGFDQAACLPVAGLAAWSALRTEARIDRGSTVLLQGTGGLAMMAFTIAKALGARVAATSSSAEKRARLQELGADFVGDSTAPAWSNAVREWSGGGVDAVLDVGGTASLKEPAGAVRDGGSILALGVMAHRSRQIDFADLVVRRIRLQGIFLGSRVEFSELLDFVAANRIEPLIDQVYEGLGQARRAIANFVGGGHLGKIVVRVA